MRKYIQPIVATLTLLLPLAAAKADSELRLKAAEMSKGIQKFLEGQGENRIAVGQFTGPAEYDTNFGPGLENLLAAELKSLGVANDRKANFSLKGDYLKVADKHKPNLISVKLIARIFDKQAGQALIMEADVQTTEDLARMLQPSSATLPPYGDRETRNEDLQKQLNEPKTQVDDARISAKPDGLLAIEILVKPSAEAKAQPRAPKLVDGQSFVDVKRNELYEVRVFNRHPELDAAVTLTIDGLDVFTFSEVRDDKTGRPSYAHYVVPANSSATIPGWHKTNQRSDSFLVTEYGKGAASQAQQATGKIGVITVTYAFAWTGDEVPKAEKGARESRNETGFGPPVKTELKEVERHVGVLREVISVRYTR